MKRLTIFALGLCVITSALAETGWVQVSSHKDGTTWQVKAGSLDFAKTKGGQSIAVVVGKITDPNTSNVSLYKWYVTAADCSNKMGTLVTLDLKGDYKYENDFVFDAGNIASSIAKAICGAAESTIKNKRDKSM